ncbi:MAG: hypothetical protein A3I66_14680 [Burkholderiales bacterium RIFCSPLOWO2_02_FULL_57_36]|nr:MAG: hypothetical protein A3I66_14680 [Burkholderiales bacterium RIFCSPLOWO2_02_FULL_57_36]
MNIYTGLRGKSAILNGAAAEDDKKACCENRSQWLFEAMQRICAVFGYDVGPHSIGSRRAPGAITANSKQLTCIS